MGAKKTLKSAGVSAVMKKPKPFNSGNWTEARMRSFVMSALRRARWPVKYEAIRKAYVKDGINPATGRKCKLHKCESCGNLFPQSQMAADHKDPVVPLKGFTGEAFLDYNWTELIQRLFCEADALQVLCHQCHREKTKEERAMRKSLLG
jgi:hypothetical protein